MMTNLDKQDIIQWIVGLEDQTTLLEIRTIKQRATAHENDLSLQELEAIKQGLDDSDSGRLSPHTEVKKRYEKWL